MTVAVEQLNFQRDLKKPIFLFALFAFALYTHALDRVLSGNGNTFSENSSSALVQISALFLIAVSGLGLLLRPQISRLGPESLAYIALSAFAILSTTWSLDSSLTFRRSISFTGTLITLAFLYRYMNFENMWRAFLMFCVSFTVIQFVLLVGASNYAFHSASDVNVAEHAGRFRGFYFHKNETGRFGLVTFLALLVSRDYFKKRSMFLALLAMSLITLLATQSSKLVLAIPTALLFLYFLQWRISAGLKLLIAGYVAAGCAVIILGIDLTAFATEALGLIGRDTSLSGRDVLWHIAIDQIKDNPWIGNGLYAGWTQSAKDILFVIKGENGVVNHAHNGYLQLLLDLGVVGLVLALVPPVLVLSRLAKLPRAQWRPIDRFAALFVVSYFILNLAGSYLLGTNDLFPFMMLYLAMHLRHRQIQPKFDAKRADTSGVQFGQ